VIDVPSKPREPTPKPTDPALLKWWDEEQEQEEREELEREARERQEQLRALAEHLAVADDLVAEAARAAADAAAAAAAAAPPPAAPAASTIGPAVANGGYVNIPAGARWDGSRWVPPEASQGSDTRSDAEECDDRDCEDDDDADGEDGDSEDDFGFPW